MAGPIKPPTFPPLPKYFGTSALVIRRCCQPLSIGLFLPNGTGTGAMPREIRSSAICCVLMTPPCASVPRRFFAAFLNTARPSRCSAVGFFSVGFGLGLCFCRAAMIPARTVSACCGSASETPQPR